MLILFSYGQNKLRTVTIHFRNYFNLIITTSYLKRETSINLSKNRSPYRSPNKVDLTNIYTS